MASKHEETDDVIAADEHRYRMQMLERTTVIKTDVAHLKQNQDKVMQWIDDPEKHCTMGRNILHSMYTMKKEIAARKSLTVKKLATLIGSTIAASAAVFVGILKACGINLTDLGGTP